MPEGMRALIAAVLAAGVGIGGAVLGLWAAGYAPAAVAATWVHGAVGSRLAWGASLQEATPLAMTGLATALAFRAGALSIGADGQYSLGAVAFVGTALALGAHPWLAWPLALAAAVLAGSAWAGVAGLLERWRGVPLVLSTILLNFVAQALVSLLVEGPLHEPDTDAPQTAMLASAMRLPILLADTSLHLGVAITAAIVLVLAVLQDQTVAGFEIGITGANPVCARLIGIPVVRWRTVALLGSGALAALGGVFEQAGVTGYMSDSSVSYGYAGIAVALLGRLHPLGVGAAALLFGLLDAGGRELERQQGIPHDLAQVLTGTILLTVLLAQALQWRLQLRRRQA